MGANNLKSGLKGPNVVKFADGQTIRFRTPDWKLGGTIYGERTVESDGSILFDDITYQRKAQIIMSTYRKTGFFSVTETGRKD